MMNFKYSTEFQKEIKKLQKKYKSLFEDLELFKKVLSVYPKGRDKHFARLTETGNYSVYKSRFFCRYLKNESLRIIYAYEKEQDTIFFLEIYCKGDKETEDKERIEKFIQSNNL
jgi:mRNA-degrading endonuclease RelE of RelBE toxin-antitoxin system